MRHLDLDMNEALFDKHRQFYTPFPKREKNQSSYWHWYTTNWERFDNGLIVFLDRLLHPDARSSWPDEHIAVRATNDLRVKLATPDEPDKPIHHNWLDRPNRQTLLLDFDHMIAVRLARGPRTNWPRVASAAVGYVPGPNARPVGGMPIRVHRPEPGRGTVKSVRRTIDACKAWWESYQVEYPHAMVRSTWRTTSYSRGSVVEVRLLENGAPGEPSEAPKTINAFTQAGTVKTIADLTDAERAVVAEYGFEQKEFKEDHYFDYLHILT